MILIKKDAALKAAMADALRKAKVFAVSLGKRVIEVTQFDQNLIEV